MYSGNLGGLDPASDGSWYVGKFQLPLSDLILVINFLLVFLATLTGNRSANLQQLRCTNHSDPCPVRRGKLPLSR